MIKNLYTTEFTLKMVALIFMIIDHVHTYLGVGPEWVSLFPRFVSPLFVYFLVDGFHHTRSWKKYFQRVFIFAVIMMAGNICINYSMNLVNPITGKMDFYSLIQGNNIFLTLAVYLIILKLLSQLNLSKSLRKAGYIFLIFILSVLSLPFCEGSLYLLPLLFVFYYSYGNKKGVYIGLSIWSLLLFVKAYMSYHSGATGISLFSTLCFNSEWAMIFTIIPIYLYSGKRGLNTKASKWLFYIIYPTHLWILKILAHLPL